MGRLSWVVICGPSVISGVLIEGGERGEIRRYDNSSRGERAREKGREKEREMLHFWL